MRKKLDLYGVTFLAIVTAVGGGTLRDTMLGRVPPFVFKDSNYLFLSIGAAMLVLCALYVIGSWRHFKPVHFRSVHIVYPRLPVVLRQLIAAPLELAAAAGIIYFVLPETGNPGFLVVLGAFMLSFSAGLLSQTPGGIGVMEAVFLALLPSIPPSDTVAALLIWRLMYLMIPLALSVPLIVAFERLQLRRDDNSPQPSAVN